MLRHNAAIICASPLFTDIVDCLKSSLKDDKFLVRESSVQYFRKLLLYQSQNDPSNSPHIWHHCAIW
ncbi:eIF-2-alpha kinase activator GCN1 [Salvia divinorum]|uniref:EIF-2-alpha kinase activator GCN1 n=1 Tax=Salvia divinorum TaxID=28513 RepID=A0ABD1FLX5_SALDI